MTGGHFDVKRARVLDSEERLKELRPLELLADVGGVKPGMTCVDLGCGTGTFTLPLARLAGEPGAVYAVDDSAEMLAYLRDRGLPANVRLVERDAASTGLEAGIADFCLLAFILHEVRDPEKLVREAARLLKAGGRASVVEWKAGLDSPGPPRGRRVSKERLTALFRQASFPSPDFRDWSGNHYVASATRTSG